MTSGRHHDSLRCRHCNEEDKTGITGEGLRWTAVYCKGEAHELPAVFK